MHKTRQNLNSISNDKCRNPALQEMEKVWLQLLAEPTETETKGEKEVGMMSETCH